MSKTSYVHFLIGRAFVPRKFPIDQKSDYLYIFKKNSNLIIQHDIQKSGSWDIGTLLPCKAMCVDEA